MTTREVEPDFEALLTHLKETRGFDFTGYKRSTLRRRITKRMSAVDIETFTDYLDYLEVHQDEFAALFDTILINVTSFFRDWTAWEELRRNVVSRIVRNKDEGAPVRVWSAGCASGEEAYSIAILLCEEMGIEAFRERVKIYATDADEDALVSARQGVYTVKSLQAVPEEYREKYFEATNGHFTFRKDLRRAIIFGRHDLVQDAPISRVDLLISRNTLMYFNADTQSRILSRFYYGLSEGGYLFLGKAETLLAHPPVLTPVDLKFRIFVKQNGVLPGSDDGRGFDSHAATDALMPAHERLLIRDLSFESDPLAQILLDASLGLSMANERARELFGITAKDVGRPLQDLDVSYRPIDLRSPIEEAIRDKRSMMLHEVVATAVLGQRWFDVHIIPLLEPNAILIGIKVVFMDVTYQHGLAEELQKSKGDLETAYEELQSSNEELETTNEELQSTVEELETTNEELQSTNEELETMNEELQSTNEELEAVNDEMRDRGAELNNTNFFMESILTSLHFGVVVVDADLVVQAWNRQAEELWGVRQEEAKRAFLFNLDIGIRLEGYLQAIQDCIAERIPDYRSTTPATNRRGRSIQVRVTIGPMRQPGKPPTGVVILMDDITTEGEGTSPAEIAPG